MSQILPLTLALLILAPQSQNLPEAYYRLPEQVRSRATVIVSGTYGQGRSPCIFMPDGTRHWTLDTWFQIKKIYRGEAGGKSIFIKWDGSPKNERAGVRLEVGREYLVLLRPNEQSMKVIKEGKFVPAWDALDDEEIVAILEVK